MAGKTGQAKKTMNAVITVSLCHAHNGFWADRHQAYLSATIAFTTSNHARSVRVLCSHKTKMRATDGLIIGVLCVCVFQVFRRELRVSIQYRVREHFDWTQSTVCSLIMMSEMVFNGIPLNGIYSRGSPIPIPIPILILDPDHEQSQSRSRSRSRS